jgi:C1A family cysteine protease
MYGDDTDQDSIPKDKDNCPSIFNPGQDEADREFIRCPPGAGALALCAELTLEAARKKCEEAAWAKANPGFTGAGCNYKSDGKGDVCDNCWEVQNIDQVDSDGDCESYKKNASYWDGTKWLKDPQCGDTCDRCLNFDNTIDSDNDGVPDGCDNCRNKPNPDQKDTDNDCYSLKQDATIWDSNKLIWKVDPHCGDLCDNCPNDWNPSQSDIDNNGIGDACDCNDRFKGQYEESWDCGAKSYLGHNGTGCPAQKCKPCDLIQNGNLPVKFTWTNWRGKNWMSPVKDQGACGSCWAESPIGVAEGQFNIEQDKPVNDDINFSEQHLVSWKPEYGMGSCKGGFNPQPIDYLFEYGVANESEFPYMSGSCLDDNNNCVGGCQSPYGSHCSFPGGVPSGPTDWQGRRWHITGYDNINKGSVYDAQPSPNYVVKQAILCHGPLSVCFSNGWHHCFVLVGWDDLTGTWIVKNSWGMGNYTKSFTPLQLVYDTHVNDGYLNLSYYDPKVDLSNMWDPDQKHYMFFVVGVWHG